MRSLLRSTFALILTCILILLAERPAVAAGAVTDCATFGPGPGTLATAVAGGGLVTFECSGTIVLPYQIKLIELPGETLVLDGSGQHIILSGGDATRLFNVGPKSHLHLRRLTLMAGNAGQHGGGAIQSGGHVTITESALLNNTAAYGGALELYNGSATIRNSTLAGNRALDSDLVTGGGGAIDQYFTYVEGNSSKETEVPVVLIVNSTIVNNEAVIGARSGIWQENGRLQLRYSIVANNGGGNCMVAPPNRQQYLTVGSLDSDGTCSAALRADPQLGPLGTGDGTPAYPLFPTSPAIDAIAPEACAGTVDQRGFLRPRDGNHDGLPGCDVGAYEYADRFVVLAAADEGLAGYWKFDEGAGETSMDSSGHALTATLHSGAGFIAGASRLRFGSPFALHSSLAAGAQVADAPGLRGGNELTVAAWVRLDGSSGLQHMLTKMQESEGGRGYGLFLRDGFLSGEAWDSAGVRHVITSEVITGSWLHVALTYRADGEQALYLNGRTVGVQAVKGSLAASSAPLMMAVNGAIDDVRVYSRTLSAGAVAALANGRGCVSPGSTWGDAVPDLQCALLEAAPGTEVWIGPGVYRPTLGPDRSATFAVGDGIGVYGGFAGEENTREQRVAQTPQPVLSGDIQANDRVDAAGVLTDVAGLVGRNAFHVVSISSTLTSTLLEDVTITGGQADGVAGAICGNGCGGGLAVTGGAPQLSRLRLIGNRAAAWGGALYADHSSTQLIFSTLEANLADRGGGGFWQGGAPLLANSLLAGNLAAGEGGGLYASNSNMRLVNVTVAGNRAGSQGGGMLYNGGGSSASNLLVGGNQAPVAPQAGGHGFTLQKGLVQDGCPATFVCAGDVLSGDPLLVAAFPISAPVSGGDYRLLPASPAIDSGDNGASLGPGVTVGGAIAALATDLAGEPRITAARVLPPQIDLGAYEAPNTPPIFVSAPLTTGTTTIEYVYEVAAIDPNLPDQLLAIHVATAPPWLALEQEQNRPALLHGTPGEIWYGYFDIRLQTADSLGAAAEQAFTIHVLVRVYWLFLAHLAR